MTPPSDPAKQTNEQADRVSRPPLTVPEGSLPQPRQTPMFRAAHAARYQRQELLVAIEQATGRRLICYVASPTAKLRREDVEGFADLLQGLKPHDDVDLMLTTTGGDPEAAGKIGHLLRRAVPHGHLRAVIPEAAKSAGTILAAGMDSIVMSDASELGPIDPHIYVEHHGADVRRPAQAYLEAFDDAVKRAAAEGPESVVWTKLLDTFEPTMVLLCRQAVGRTRSILERLLTARHAPSGGAQPTVVAANLLHPTRWTHGAVITNVEAEQIGLDIDYLPHDDDLWQAYWRLHCLQRVALQPNERLFESGYVSLHVTE